MPFNKFNPNLTLGFHGCTRDAGERILRGESFHRSTNDYDWLGPGIYFWENDPVRAMQWAHEKVKRGNSGSPMVLGAVITLGNCLDTTHQRSLKALSTAYNALKKEHEIRQTEMPTNHKGKDLLFRHLDCAVVKYLHNMLKDQDIHIDTVRGLYHEGNRLYDNSGFFEKSHIQIAVYNAACIKGVYEYTSGRTY